MDLLYVMKEEEKKIICVICSEQIVEDPQGAWGHHNAAMETQL